MSWRNGKRHGEFMLDVHMDIQYKYTIECLHDDVISDVCHLMHEVMKWRLTYTHTQNVQDVME